MLLITINNHGFITYKHIVYGKNNNHNTDVMKFPFVRYKFSTYINTNADLGHRRHETRSPKHHTPTSTTDRRILYSNAALSSVPTENTCYIIIIKRINIIIIYCRTST